MIMKNLVLENYSLQMQTLQISTKPSEKKNPNESLVDLVAEQFWYICLLERLLATAIRYTFKLLTYIQEPLVTGRRGYLQRFKRENG